MADLWMCRKTTSAARKDRDPLSGGCRVLHSQERVTRFLPGADSVGQIIQNQIALI